jgi:hypothetical protein
MDFDELSTLNDGAEGLPIAALFHAGGRPFKFKALDVNRA